MNAPTAADSVATLVDDLTIRVIGALGVPPGEGPHIEGVKHVLRLHLGKVVADYLLRAATAQNAGRTKP